MKIICDTREQAPFTFTGYACEVVAGTIPTGDYSLAGLQARLFSTRIAREEQGNI